MVYCNRTNTVLHGGDNIVFELAIWMLALSRSGRRRIWATENTPAPEASIGWHARTDSNSEQGRVDSVFPAISSSRLVWPSGIVSFELESISTSFRRHVSLHICQSTDNSENVCEPDKPLWWGDNYIPQP